MKSVAFLIPLIFVLAGCSPSARVPDAARRAERLTQAKERAAALIEAGAYRDAVDTLEPLTKEASGDYQVFVMLGDARARLDEYDRAVDAYESALRLDYTSHEAHLKLATYLMRHEQIGRALTEFELAIRYGDRRPLTHYNYGLALHGMGREEEALAEWRRAYDMDPSDSRYAQAVAIGLSGTDDDEALAFFDRARGLGADSPSFWNNYALALERTGRYGEAEARFRDAIRAAPDEEAYRFNLASMLTRAGRDAAAAREWESLIAREGRRWSYSVYLGRALLARERYDEAIAAVAGLPGLEPGGERDRTPPERHEAFEILALGSRGVGDLESARAYMERALELAPDNLVYRNNYGVILAESGMLADARAQWRRVLQADPDNATARGNLSRFGP